MPVLPIAAIGLAVVGTAVSVGGQLNAARGAALAQTAQGQRDARQAEAQARLSERDALGAEQEALEEAQASAVDIDTLTRQFRRLRGQQIAAVGARGIELQGSPLEVLAETAAEGQFEIEQTRFRSEQTQQALADEAAQSRFEARELRLAGTDAIAVSRARARTTQRAGTLGAIGTGIGGAGRVAGQVGRLLE